MFDQKEVTKRFFTYCKSIGLNDTQMAKEMGVSKQFLTQWKDNTAPIPPKRLIEFLSKREDVNANWILFGRGQMLIHADPDCGEGHLPEPADETAKGPIDLVVDPKVPYNAAQKVLEEKEKRIQEKDVYIEDLKEQVEFLKKLVKA